MSGTSVIKPVPPQDSLSELRIFVAGATRSVKTNPLELARTALSLLKTLPSTIDAVLEYFCALFDVAVAKYVSQIESDMCNGTTSVAPVSSHEEATIAEIHTVLCNCVTSSPEAWVPIISKWSLELLGELSSKYAGRAHVPLTAGLNETLQLWMSCRATRTLIDITTQCLSCRMLSDTETCINSLLDTSVVHSPHFDWVVAHVGSCFPHTVITRVLSCGLKDFCQHASSPFISGNAGMGKDVVSESGSAGASGVIAAPKLNSVVGILGHLAGSHFMDIRSALLDLFKWSLEEDENETVPLGNNTMAEEGAARRIATVPFLLHLASLSPMLLRALTTDVLQTLTPNLLPRLARLSPAWCRFFGGRQALQDLVVHLALGCERGGTQILRLLIDAATVQTDLPHPSSSQVRDNCAEILELLLQEIDLLVRSGASAGPCPSPGPHGGGGHSGNMGNLGSGNERWVPILSSVRREASAIHPLLLASEQNGVKPSNDLVSRTAVHLVSLLASAHLGPSLAAEAAAFLLRRASNNFQLATFLQLLRHTQASHPTLATDTLRRVLDSLPGDGAGELGYSGQDEPPLRFWLNLHLLLKHEASEVQRHIRQNTQVSSHSTKQRQRSHPYSNEQIPHRPILAAVRTVLSDITHALCASRNSAMRHAAALVLERALPQAREMSAVSMFSSPELALKLARAAVVHFFLSSAEQEFEEQMDFQDAAAVAGVTVNGTAGCRVACRILARLVPISSAARALALRDLLEGALVHPETASLFGAKGRSEDNASLASQLPTKGKSPLSRAVLLWENGRPRTALPRRHSSVFGVGEGDALRTEKYRTGPPCPEVVALNTQMLIEAIKCCCIVPTVNIMKESETDTLSANVPASGPPTSSTTGAVSLDAISMVSLLLVEIISPDIMYNGLPWPEEEFCKILWVSGVTFCILTTFDLRVMSSSGTKGICGLLELIVDGSKVTIERDLQIRRTFERLPVIWALLTLAATHRPALCYCSVLLRAIMATLLAQWNSHTIAITTAISNHSAKPLPPLFLLANTQRLIDILALGQLLPSPLCAVRDVIPKIGPHEIVVLLRDIWNYTHENVPSPALFSQDANSGLVWRQGMGPGAEEAEGEISSARPLPKHTDSLRHTLQLHIDSLGTLYPRLFSLNPRTVASSPASPNPEDCGKIE